MYTFLTPRQIMLEMYGSLYKVIWNINISRDDKYMVVKPYQKKNSHYKDEMVLRPFNLYKGNFCTGKTVFLQWIGPQVPMEMLGCTLSIVLPVSYIL